VSNEASKDTSVAAEHYARRPRRKSEGEGEELGELNLTAMIDMMTILLVFLLKSYSVSSTNISISNLDLPRSVSPENIVEATKITINKKGSVLVDEKPVPMPDGSKLTLVKTDKGMMFSDESLNKKGGYIVPSLQTRLGEAADKQKRILEKQQKDLHSKVLLIADAEIPFLTVSQVLTTLGQVTIETKDGKDGWFNEYRLVVLSADKK
jgi:biopolymer transport protein ExbD